MIKADGVYGHVNNGKGYSDSWITPTEIIRPLGKFDLDPCCCTPQPWECAEKGFMSFGLEKEWSGRVWLNPPYSEIWPWMERLADHGRGTALIFARTETKGFVEHVWGRATAVMFLHGRLRFHYPDGQRAKMNCGAPSCLVTYGPDDARLLHDSGLDGTIVRNWTRKSND